MGGNRCGNPNMQQVIGEAARNTCSEIRAVGLAEKAQNGTSGVSLLAVVRDSY